jgi:cbb3-type cytochrome oxidase maturation protein
VSVVYVLIPLGLVLVGFAAWAFFWAVGSGQFDDLDTPGWSVLVDEKAAATDSDRAAGKDADSEEPGT